jgi:hypothetical protein
VGQRKSPSLAGKVLMLGQLHLSDTITMHDIVLDLAGGARELAISVQEPTGEVVVAAGSEDSASDDEQGGGAPPGFVSLRYSCAAMRDVEACMLMQETLSVRGVMEILEVGCI